MADVLALLSNPDPVTLHWVLQKAQIVLHQEYQARRTLVNRYNDLMHRVARMEDVFRAAGINPLEMFP